MATNNGNNGNGKNNDDKNKTHYKFKITAIHNGAPVDTTIWVRPNKLEKFFVDMSKNNRKPIMISAPNVESTEFSDSEDQFKESNVFDPNNPNESLSVDSDISDFSEEGEEPTVIKDEPKPPKVNPTYQVTEHDYIYACFVSDTLVDMFDGSTKEIQNIEEGDLVKSFKDGEYVSGKVTKKLIYEINDVVPVAILKGITGSIYHPVFVDNKWIELGEAPITEIKSNMFIDTYYNLEIDGDSNNSNHNYIINGHIMSGLGDCERLNNKFKRQNIYKEIV